MQQYHVKFYKKLNEKKLFLKFKTVFLTLLVNKLSSQDNLLLAYLNSKKVKGQRRKVVLLRKFTDITFHDLKMWVNLKLIPSRSLTVWNQKFESDSLSLWRDKSYLDTQSITTSGSYFTIVNMKVVPKWL